MSAEYARRNLACASHHKCPDGWQSWGGNTSGWQKRPFCWGEAGHPGDHWAWTQRIGKSETVNMKWPNTIGIPSWLAETTIHGLKMLAANGGPDDTEDIINALNGRT